MVSLILTSIIIFCTSNELDVFALLSSSWPFCKSSLINKHEYRLAQQDNLHVDCRVKEVTEMNGM